MGALIDNLSRSSWSPWAAVMAVLSAKPLSVRSTMTTNAAPAPGGKVRNSFRGSEFGKNDRAPRLAAPFLIQVKSCYAT
jgi:hypothetical protein